MSGPGAIWDVLRARRSVQIAQTLGYDKMQLMHDDDFWAKIPGPEDYRPTEVQSAFIMLASVEDQAGAQAAYNSMLFAIGNNHRGTMYPAAVFAVEELGTLTRSRSTWTRWATIQVLIDLVACFEPESGFDLVGVDGSMLDVQEAVRSNIQAVARDLDAHISAEPDALVRAAIAELVAEFSEEGSSQGRPSPLGEVPQVEGSRPSSLNGTQAGDRRPVDESPLRRLLISVASVALLAGLLVSFVMVADRAAPTPECTPDTFLCGFSEWFGSMLLAVAFAVLVWACLVTLVLFRLGYSDLRWMLIVFFVVGIGLVAWPGALVFAAIGTWFLQADGGHPRRWRDIGWSFRDSLVPSSEFGSGWGGGGGSQ